MSRSDKPPLSLRRVWVKTGFLFFTVLLVSGTVVGLSEVVRHERLSNEAIRLAADQGQLIQRQINQGLSAVYAIAALVRQGNGQVNDFERVASSLLRVQSLDSLQLAPDAVVRQIVPLETRKPSATTCWAMPRDQPGASGHRNAKTDAGRAV